MSEEFLSRLDKQAREWAEGRDRTKRIGLWMVISLVVGTIIEYAIAITVSKNLPIMVVINVVEAAAIMWFFMHVARVWRGKEH